MLNDLNSTFLYGPNQRSISIIISPCILVDSKTHKVVEHLYFSLSGGPVRWISVVWVGPVFEEAEEDWFVSFVDGAGERSKRGEDRECVVNKSHVPHFLEVISSGQEERHLFIRCGMEEINPNFSLDQLDPLEDMIEVNGLTLIQLEEGGLIRNLEESRVLHDFIKSIREEVKVRGELMIRGVLEEGPRHLNTVLQAFVIALKPFALLGQSL